MAVKFKNENKHAFYKYLLTSTALNQNSVLFDFGNVMVHRNYLQSEGVRIISGGSYVLSEFVGKGMITSAVQGEQYTAPPSKIILRTIRELCFNHLKGCFIIVPANSGNTLNFGLAVTRALNDRLNVNLLAINDEFISNAKNIPYQKGLTAILLIAKIAGAMSEELYSLAEICSFCNSVEKNVLSTGLRLHSTSERSTCICNETGMTVVEHDHRKSLIQADYCHEVVNTILNLVTHDSSDDHRLYMTSTDSVVLLLNNNRALTGMEEFLCVRELVDVLNSMLIEVDRIYIGNFLDCLEGLNFTATLLKVHDRKVLEFLDAPCEAPGWRKVYQHKPITVNNTIPGMLRLRDRLAPPVRGPKLSGRLANTLLFSVQFACDALISCERQLNIMDSESGDGDTGTRLKNASEVILKRARQSKFVTNFPFTFFESLSKILESTVGGTLGCIYSILFEAVSLCFSDFEEEYEITPELWLEALRKAAEALQKYGNVKYGEGTMYDPIEACCMEVENSFKDGDNFIEAFGKGVARAEEVAQTTRKENEKYPNPGAHAVGIWMRAVYEGVKLRCPSY